MTALQRVALSVPFVIFLGIYATAVGHGFVADDFEWILDSRVNAVSEVPSLFLKSTGFYRPVVGLTFAANYTLFGNQPLGYGLTNLVLALVCAALLFLVARELSLPRAAAGLAVVLWLLNPHGISMAILWMSGRTSLMLTIGSLAAALVLLRRRPFAALIPVAVALFSKEEAVMLPAMLFVWWIAARPEDAQPKKRLLLWGIAAAALLGFYLLLRFQTGAMTPWTAPPYYRFTMNPSKVARNMLEYGDRALTFPAAVVLIAILLLRPATRAEWFSKPIAICGAAWIVGGYSLTVFLPVRSSLYACLPSVGACLIAADIASRRWSAVAFTSRQRVAIAGIALAIGLTLMYVLRNQGSLDNARFSSSVLQDLAAATTEVPDGQTVLVVDDRRRQPNIETAFNMALNEAFELATGRRLQFWVEPVLYHATLAGLTPPCGTCVRLTVTVRDGHVVE